MTNLSIPIYPGEPFDATMLWLQPLIAIEERRRVLYQEIGYPSGPSEAGRITGGDELGHGDPTPAALGRDGRIHDPELRTLTAILRREGKIAKRDLLPRTWRLYQEAGWERLHPNYALEVAKGYREGDGRLRVVGS